MSDRVKVTGYFDIEPEDVDGDHPTGMTEEAYLRDIMNEEGTGLRVADLDGVEVTPA